MSGNSLSDKKILLHTCCAICSAYPIVHLRELGYEPIAYFFNPNIYPSDEYQKRLDAQKKLCETFDCELIIDDYWSEIYDEVTQGYENEDERGERCTKCFELRLLKTVQKAKELGISGYTTSIPISPYKNFELISQIGEKFSHYFKINFLGINFKKKDGFLKTNKIAKELSLYRQNYCGCSHSFDSSLKSRIAKAENLND